VTIISLIAWMVLVAPAQREPTADEILSKVDGLLAGINDLTVSLDIVAEMDRLSVPPMKARFYFKQPDKMHFTSEGFAIIPREGLGLALGRLRERFAGKGVEPDTAAGKAAVRVYLEPRRERSPVKQMFVVVDAERWTTERFSATTADGRILNATIVHQRLDGRWLPATMVIHFQSLRPDSGDAPLWDSDTSPAPRRADLRNGTVTIQFSGYHINGGLSDDLFTKPPRQ
jgi:outer membrane lipoprotein-sorting protein